MAYRLEVLEQMMNDPYLGTREIDIVPEAKAGKCEEGNCGNKGTHYYAAAGAIIYALCKKHAEKQHNENIVRYRQRYGLMRPEDYRKLELPRIAHQFRDEISLAQTEADRLMAIEMLGDNFKGNTRLGLGAVGEAILSFVVEERKKLRQK